MQTITFDSFDIRQIAKTMTRFVGFGGIEVTTRQTSYGAVPVDTVLLGTAQPLEVTATSDGMGYLPEWHDGDSDDLVYVERYSPQGREFHGWVDRTSRRLVQVG